MEKYQQQWILLACMTVSLSASVHAALFTHNGSDYYQHQYPHGSLACKLYNSTGLDCSYRKLTTIPFLDDNFTVTLDFSNNLLTNITSRPFTNLHSLRHLYLDNNKLNKIDDDAFYGLEHLGSLHLQENYLVIIGEPFKHTASLTELYLHSNRIQFLSSNTFHGLQKLTTLDLSRNLIQSLSNGIFRDLHSLEILDLSSNFMKIVPSDVLSPLYSLKRFDMLWSIITLPYFGHEFNNLRNLTEMTFTFSDDTVPTILTNDTFLHLSNTLLKSLTFSFPWNAVIDTGIFGPLKCISHFEITGTVQSIHALESVDSELEDLILYDLQQTKLDVTTFQPLHKFNSSLISLKILGRKFVLQENLQRIEASAFSWFPNLEELSLKGNRLTYLDKDAFFGLRKLQILDLSENHLTTLPVAALDVFSKVSSLLHLDFSSNKFDIPDSECLYLDDLANIASLKHLHIGRNSFNAIDIRRGKILNNLLRLYLEDMENTAFFDIRFDFHQLPSLTVLDFHRKDNGYLFMHHDVHICQKCTKLTYLDISNWKFPGPIQLTDFIGQDCMQLQTLDISGTIGTNWDDTNISTIYSSYLKVLKMARNGLTSASQVSVIAALHLQYLDLSSNDIQQLGVNLAAMFPKLKNLNLQDNRLNSMNLFYTLPPIQNLNIAKNSFIQLPAKWLAKTSHAGLKQFNIGDNPFDCTCAIEPFRHWVFSDSHTILVPNHMYQCKSPGNLTGFSISNIELDCSIPYILYLMIALPCCLLLLEIIVTLLYYHKHIEYKLFLLFHRKQYKNYQKLKNQAVDILDEFDAHIASADDARDWVYDELIPNLEQGSEPFKLAFLERGDLPHGYLPKTISYGIDHSHKMIAVLTKKFVEDGLCHFQLEIAKMKLLDENKNVLIFIILHPLPEDKKSWLLRKLLRDTVTLEWLPDTDGQTLFWERLKKELVKPSMVDRRFEEV